MLPLNQTQKVRFERAMERLKSLSSTENSVIVTTDSIPVNHDDDFLKGHETCERSTVSCWQRSVELWFTWTSSSIVVGRIIEVGQSRWRMELNSTQDGLLNLSSTKMHDAVQKRSSSVDELNMRNIFVEDDVICAEVGSIHRDGKLEKGHLLKVDLYLVKKSNHHFHYIQSLGVDLIIGCNGFIWVGEHVQVQDPMILNTGKQKSNTPLETRLSIVRIGNVIRVLSNLGFTMTLEVIMETVNLGNTENIDIHDMLGSEFHVLVAENEAGKRIRRS